jgi:serine/threonine protein kinase
MPLTIGSRLGLYEVTAPLGAGGMGEVYRARDPRLDREVTIKVLPPGFAAVPDRAARFEREARVLASLNHPAIAAIYGFERDADTAFLILELVPGETLLERIARGPLPVDDALRLAKQIADARIEIEDALVGGAADRLEVARSLPARPRVWKQVVTRLAAAAAVARRRPRCSAGTNNRERSRR